MCSNEARTLGHILMAWHAVAVKDHYEAGTLKDMRVALAAAEARARAREAEATVDITALITRTAQSAIDRTAGRRGNRSGAGPAATQPRGARVPAPATARPGPGKGKGHLGRIMCAGAAEACRSESPRSVTMMPLPMAPDVRTGTGFRAAAVAVGRAGLAE